MSSRNLCKTLLLTLCVLAVSAYGENIVTNPGFEEGTTGWAGRGCKIEAVTTGAHSGNGCAKAIDRMDAWQGIKQDMLDKMEAGKTYTISGWAKLAEAGSTTITISFEKADDAGTKYANVAKAKVTDSNWVEISGEFAVEASGSMTVLDLYFEGPDAGASFYVDDVSVSVKDSSAPAAGSGEKKTSDIAQVELQSLCQKDNDANDVPSGEPNEPKKESTWMSSCGGEDSNTPDSNEPQKEFVVLCVYEQLSDCNSTPSGEPNEPNKEFVDLSSCEDSNDTPSEEPNEPNKEINLGAGCQKKEDPNDCPKGKDPNEAPKKCEPKFKGISLN